MQLVIVLLIFASTLFSSFDLPQSDRLLDRQALSLRSINWFRYWRKKPAIFTPAPVMTPEYRPVIMPRHGPIVTPTPTPARKWLIFPQTTKTPTTSPAPTPRTSYEPAQNNLNQRFKTLEDEVMGAKQKKSLFSTDHANRILRDLSGLENNGYSKVE